MKSVRKRLRDQERLEAWLVRMGKIFHEKRMERREIYLLLNDAAIQLQINLIPLQYIADPNISDDDFLEEVLRVYGAIVACDVATLDMDLAFRMKAFLGNDEILPPEMVMPLDFENDRIREQHSVVTITSDNSLDFTEYHAKDDDFMHLVRKIQDLPVELRDKIGSYLDCSSLLFVKTLGCEINYVCPEYKSLRESGRDISNICCQDRQKYPSFYDASSDSASSSDDSGERKCYFTSSYHAGCYDLSENPGICVSNQCYGMKFDDYGISRNGPPIHKRYKRPCVCFSILNKCIWFGRTKYFGASINNIGRQSPPKNGHYLVHKILPFNI